MNHLKGKVMFIKLKWIFCITLILCNKFAFAVPEFRKAPGFELLLLVGPSAEFSNSSKWVNYAKNQENNSKLMIYAHGGAGLIEADKLRVSLFKNMGFDTLAFDAFAMNELDGTWVNRNLTDRAKQDLIMNIMIGAIDAMLKNSKYTNVVLYGQSNGAKVIINAFKQKENFPQIKLILSEGPPPSGYALPFDIQIPTFIFFGEKDNWGGTSENDLMWKRKYPWQQVSIMEWVDLQSTNGKPVKMIFYPNSGHSFHSGKLTPVSRNMAGMGVITGYLGANDKDRRQYEDDIKRIVVEYVK